MVSCNAILFLDEVHRDFPMVSPADGYRLNFERVPRTDFPKQAWRHFNRSSRGFLREVHKTIPGIGLGRFSDRGQARFSTEDNGRFVFPPEASREIF